MRKIVIALNGDPKGKAEFIHTLKNKGFWCWNINHRNVLSMAANRMGWFGDRDIKYYTFVDEVNKLANEYFDFEKWYINHMVERFNVSRKAEVMIIHNCNRDNHEYLLSNLDNYYTVFIKSETCTDGCFDDEHVLNYYGNNFPEATLKLIDDMLEMVSEEEYIE
jgi:hypothetical protein